MIIQIALKKAQYGYPSFHPKFWLLRFKSETEVRYRVIILSRNLTFDRSWDVSVVLEGRLVNEQQEKTKPLIDFLEYLAINVSGGKGLPKGQRKMIRDMKSELKYVEFLTENKMFTDFEFLPVGIKSEDKNQYTMNQTRLFSETFHELFVISPFLSKEVIKDFNKPNISMKEQFRTLITRKNELCKMKPEDYSNFAVYSMKDEIVDGEESISGNENETDIRQQDIHAKVYIWRKYNEVEMYLGSLNASTNALKNNVEFMIRLTGRSYDHIDRIIKHELIESEDSPFELLTNIPQEPDGTDESSLLQAKLKKLIRSGISGKVIKASDDFSIVIQVQKICDSEGVSISPIMKDTFLPLGMDVRFENLKLLEVSSFFRIRVKGVTSQIEKILKIEMEDMPEGRESAVFSKILETKKSFIQYISFLLGDDYLLSMLENMDLDKNIKKPNQKTGDFKMPALYEKMLKTVCEYPERLGEIEYVMNLLKNKNVIPDGFEETYQVFKRVAGKR